MVSIACTERAKGRGLRLLLVGACLVAGAVCRVDADDSAITPMTVSVRDGRTVDLVGVARRWSYCRSSRRVL